MNGKFTLAGIILFLLFGVMACTRFETPLSPVAEPGVAAPELRRYDGDLSANSSLSLNTNTTLNVNEVAIENPGELEDLRKAARLARFCSGFEGSCEIEELKIKIELKFSGVNLRLPTYEFLNWGGRARGWIFPSRYFGSRTLTISQTSRSGELKILGQFRQSLWNQVGYTDLSQYIKLDLKAKKVLVAADGELNITRPRLFEIAYE